MNDRASFGRLEVARTGRSLIPPVAAEEHHAERGHDVSSEVALGAHRNHRPNAAAVRSGSASDDAAKSPVTPSAPADAAPSPAAGSKTGDTTPIDTSITVNQGHQPIKRKGLALAKPPAAHPPSVVSKRLADPIPHHPVPVTRNAAGAAVERDKTVTAGKLGVTPVSPTPPARRFMTRMRRPQR
jgi:hypothetical protein